MIALAVEDRLLDFLRSRTGSIVLNAETELLEDGIVDSLMMMDLMMFIETELNVRLDFADLNAEAFRTPAALAALIATRQEDARASPAAL